MPGQILNKRQDVALETLSLSIAVFTICVYTQFTDSFNHNILHIICVSEVQIISFKYVLYILTDINPVWQAGLGYNAIKN